MNALIPHKDTVLALARIQKCFIASYNKTVSAKDYLFPSFPLFAFSETEITNPKEIAECNILSPETNGMQFYFPLIINYKDKAKAELKIIFAASREEIKKVPEYCSGTFPISMRIFKQGKALLENNCWQIFDDSWIKIE